MDAKIISNQGRIIYDDQDENKLIAYYHLNDYFMSHPIGPKTADAFYPDFSQDSWILKYPSIIERYAQPALVERLHRLQHNNLS
ncbi:hypothetical protein [Oenococcus kitaharae]|uniref:Uncharacterized protein n=1 Tax=Oenococcus kitaharae DSM 17330 TaxID=1045004 RepID=G9WH99_9LACO|nr:hypothetical protein [Oenococcus kitaharae]EHN59665.1 hypothetical protein OKIT_1588 [Oenococcus kitaharae DSM 17330]OEY83505.1 hypothetical protein NT95_05145 [Oenococcus kitaharae]OEY85304.1 hypothetical protein NT96_01590 [Oenococcus kitaharae]OEY86158.1 hypothetical protein NV75_01540 [Oenococcus kitaharae]